MHEGEFYFYFGDRFEVPPARRSMKDAMEEWRE